ncbi:MAG: hypothetical protein M1830_000770 [Pleopsidium flavum]|nr:MAG: hypothetical protein M1830_000770 [Pleopsidium flavum]
MDIVAVDRNQTTQHYQSTKITRSHELEPQLWSLLNSYFPQANSDLRFWWKTTGVPFAILLEKAGYSIDAQRQKLFFYYYCVVPELGAGSNAQGLPRYWKSFMTDHFSPIELSWEWGCGGESATVRFSIEPIGPYAGTSADPLNQHATTRVVHHYQRLLSDCDLQLFDHFSKELLSYNHSPGDIGKGPDYSGHRSRTFVAVDLGEDGDMLKAYFLPTFKATELGLSTWGIISQAIQNLPAYSPSVFSGLSILQNFLRTSPQGSGLEAEILAVDCMAPARSRLKIYMRSQSTCFDSVREIMTLGGVLGHSYLNRGLNELQKLWKLVLSQGQDFSAAEDLQPRAHRTAGILYYFDMKQGKALPGVKVYIPVRHYGQNDLAIAEGLRVYLKSRGQDPLACKYMKALKSISPSSSLRSRCGIQTYLGCSIVGEELKLTSYLSPEVYKMQLC